MRERVPETSARPAGEGAAAGEDLLHRALRSGRIAAWEWDLDSGLVTWSSNARELLGLDTGPTTDFDERVHPDDRDRHGQALRETLDHGTPYAIELRFHKPDGSLIWIEDKAELRTTEGGRRILIGITMDITRRKAQEAKLYASEERYRLVAKATNEAVWDADIGRGEVIWNDTTATLFRYPPEAVEHTGDWWRERIHPEDRARVVAKIQTVFDTGQDHWAQEYRFLRGDGTYVHVLDRGYVLRDQHGRPVRYLGAMQDLTERKEAEKAVAESEARYRLLAENATDMIIQADLDTTRRYVSPACRELLGYAPEELVGTRPLDAVHPEDIERYRAILDNLTAGHTDLAVSRQRYRRKDGTFVWTEATFRLIRGEGGEPTGYVASVRDISERRQLEEQLRELARTDGLTGLFNRRAFEERLDEEWRRALRSGSAFGLLTLDVDFFKQYNDHFGHGAGDECLRRVADLLRQERRATDFAARIGGEEFALLLPETELAGALTVAEGIRLRLEGAGMGHPKSPHGVVTASIGVAAFRPQATQSVADLLNASDQAMYEAKRTGRNRVVSAGAPD
jgi:diguanylate cyclase (GGDEF)-like protein/PAS domain S-box-containing protein